MRVTIGDLDYYYAEDRRDLINPDVMKISSYHKQLGDTINFVLTQDDIRRPYDIYYIIKEKATTQNPPYDFFVNKKVKWGGKAYKAKINGKMSDAMLACRPDYLIYPNKQTKFERSEQVRLLNNSGNLLPITQDGTNSFTNKRVIETDTALWTTSTENCKEALKRLASIKNLTFLEPIWIQKLIHDKDIQSLFFELKLNQGANIQGLPIGPHEFAEAKEIILRAKEVGPCTGIGALPIKINYTAHWERETAAIEDFQLLKNILVECKKHKIKVEIIQPKERLKTPFFFPFEALSKGTKKMFDKSGLEFLTSEYGKGLRFNSNINYWSNSGEWSEPFRDLLRQTGDSGEFLVGQGGEKQLSANEIPGQYGKKEFDLGL